ncbi:MAG: endonuclease MutS2 [Firmicutes bacterium]|nr:endonuclease MutS2 [Bacillota bacterium]
MNEKALRVLEFNKVIEMLEAKASSSLGKEFCRELKPSSDLNIVKQWLSETTEASGMMLQVGTPPIGPFYDLKNSLKLAEIGGCLSPKQLLEVADSLRTSRSVKKFITSSGMNRETYPVLYATADRIQNQLELEKHIELCIIGESQISDHASPELKRIRRGIESKNAAIRSKLESMITSPAYQKYLQDAIITIRQDRFVIPVKSEHKNQVKGLVHDQSAKGSTFYIEPLAVVELNNELRELLIQEQKEIERILRVLTGEVADVSGSIGTNIEAMTQLDFLFAKGKLSLDMRAVEPEVNTVKRFRIKNGRHPLISKDVVVPSNVWLGDKFSTLLITGPNTGGKTVTLKTVGLITLMAQAGLHVPADYGTEVAIFDEVFADIGDEQSIEQSLSTFSSHMTNIVRILKEVTPDSLVLFDELGAGTDPTEGAALAMAILDQLLSKGIRTMATTHYSELKEFAIVTEGIENACVEFNVETLSPTYKLLIGIPGKSNAFEISQKLGLDTKIIAYAKEYIHKDDIRFEDILANIEKSQRQIEQERDEAIRMRLEVEKLKRSLQEKEDKWLRQRDDLVRKSKEEARELLKQAKDEADEIIKSLRDIKSSVDASQNKDVEEMRKRLLSGIDRTSERVIKSEAVNEFAPDSLLVGDSVRVLSINQEGTVITLPNDKGDLTVQVGLMKMNVNLKQLAIINKKKKDEKVFQKVREFTAKSATISPEIDVRGSNTEEAISIIDKYLDDAAISSLSQVRIIHGKGTGALRKGLHEHFRGHPHVKKFEDAAYNEGGSGATVITLK